MILQNKPKIKQITFTGADDSCKPSTLANYSCVYPFIEWGILFPSNNISRFPSKEWLRELVAVSTESKKFDSFPIKLSAHICEPWVEGLINGSMSYSDLENEMGKETLQIFDRIQLNFHSYPYTSFTHKLSLLIQNNPDKEFILQLDGINNWIVNSISSDKENASLLVDKSSGSGKFDNVWAEFANRKFGYAGGLDIKTLPLAIEKWKSLKQPLSWIDIESGVRDMAGGFCFKNIELIIKYLLPYIYTGQSEE